MTLSDNARVDFLNTALRRMRDELDDRWIGEMRFEVASEHFSDLPQTTWLDMQQELWIKPDNDSGGRGFKFTGAGLIAAMKLSGELQDPEHKARCVRLKAAFKALVKDRELPGVSTDTWTLVAQTALTDRWIWNALDARFLAHEWPNEYVDIEVRSGGRDLRVPANFGSRRLWGMEAGPLTPTLER